MQAKHGQLSWQQKSDKHFTSEVPPSFRPGSHQHPSRFIDITEEALGSWQLRLDSALPGDRPLLLGRYKQVGEAMGHADKLVAISLTVEGKAASWRQHPPSDSLKAYAKHLYIPTGLAKNSGHLVDMIKHIEAKQWRKFSL